jgi:hypothetical protein
VNTEPAHVRLNSKRCAPSKPTDIRRSNARAPAARALTATKRSGVSLSSWYRSLVGEAPLSEWEKEQVRKYLHEDKDHTRGAVWVIMLGGVAVGAVVGALTQPWPRRGPGGGYGANNLGPGITALAVIATVLILAKLLRRRQPPRAPRL